MGIAKRNQIIQDWLTQQWVILFGVKLDNSKHKWLLGPFGGTSGIGRKFVEKLAKDEKLIIDNDGINKGLLDSFDLLNLAQDQLEKLSPNLIDFYQNTSNYELLFKANWNPFIMVSGILLKRLFSHRIEQLNIPIKNIGEASSLSNEIIKLLDSETKEVQRTIWLRAIKSTAEVIYSGVYEPCTLPSRQTCIKAVFPLPNGNATVILKPSVGENGDLILDSSGQKLGDSGFYFLLEDAKGQLWAKFISSFKDKLVLSSEGNSIRAIQTLSLWNLRVLKFEYEIKKLPLKNGKNNS